MPLAIPTGPRHRTKQEIVYQTLRDAIMTCELQPGERLVIDELARRLEVSAIPVREALQMLQSEGLVINVPHTGAVVAPILRESIVDIFSVLEGLEGVATRWVVDRARPEDLEMLAQLVTAMDEAVAAERYEQWAASNKHFHVSISALPGLPMLREMTERAFDCWDRVRRYYFRGVVTPRVRRAQREHHEILAALRKRNAAKVQDLVRQHNQNALAAYMTYLDEAVEGKAAGSPVAAPRK